MNNSVFGKTLENIRNRVDILFISSNKVAQKLAAKPNYDRCTIIDQNLITVHMKKTKLYFDKPGSLGMSILTWVNPWCMTLITTTLRPKIFTKISTPTLRNGLTLVTTQQIIQLELKQNLIVKCLASLRMKLVGSKLPNLLVWELNFTLTKCFMASTIKM